MLAKLGNHKAHPIKKGDRLTRSGVMKIVEEMLEEEEIVNPVFFTEYFTFLCPLAKTMPENPAISQRFEVFIGGLEIGNNFKTLGNGWILRHRFGQRTQE